MVKRPLVASFNFSPNNKAALFQEWPTGVMMPSRISLAWAKESVGKANGRVTPYVSAFLRETVMRVLLGGEVGYFKRARDKNG